MILATTERASLAQTLHTLGPDAPTLCTGWDTFDLVTHMWLRENEPLTALGMFFPPLSTRTRRRMAEVKASEDFDDLVDKFAAGPAGIFRFAKIDEIANSLEYFVHHEDVRRGKEPKNPRILSAQADETLWNWAKRLAKTRLAKSAHGIVITRTGSKPGAQQVVSTGAEIVEIIGEPGELVLWLYGRKSAARLNFAGKHEPVKAVQELKLTV